ncbi:MAG: endonuclease III domain-containing protein [Chitinispirillia bacterium]|nr:endonuclease III domain-containing protein [Chitinispirillia bacterium]MCL2269332.1 endonuclease III domain-containing protein [Chitinispirillia bacterium]
MADKKLASIYKKLFCRYGDLQWWPARTPYEVIAGAVLTQNTAWTNVEKAIINFGEDGPEPEFVASVRMSKLTDIIRPAGFFNQKAVYLKSVTKWFERYDYDVRKVKREPLEKLRGELLSTKGVGPETADSILLYAFDLPTFVIDAYTMRLCGRYPVDAGKTYSQVKAYFEDNLPKGVELYNNFHALIVANAKEHCRKKPLCAGCPLERGCKCCC